MCTILYMWLTAFGNKYIRRSMFVYDRISFGGRSGAILPPIGFGLIPLENLFFMSMAHIHYSNCSMHKHNRYPWQPEFYIISRCGGL